MRRHLPLLLALALLAAPGAAQAAPAAPSSATPAAVLSPTAALLAPLDAAEPEEEGEEDLEGWEEAEELEAEDCEGEAFAFEAELEEEGFEEELEAEEAEFEESEECGEEEDGKTAGPGAKSDAPGAQGPDSGVMTAPAACLVRRAEATVTALPTRGRLQLTVHYKAYAPTAVTVGLKLKDRKGAATLQRATKHLGAGGALHLSTKLGDGVMERVGHAHRLDVSLRAPRTPGYCGDLLEAPLHVAGGHHRAGAPRVFHG